MISILWPDERGRDHPIEGVDVDLHVAFFRRILNLIDHGEVRPAGSYKELVIPSTLRGVKVMQSRASLFSRVIGTPVLKFLLFG